MYHKVTIKMRNAMRNDRAAGMTFKAIAEKYGVAYTTTVYHVNSDYAERSKAAWKARQARVVDTPEKRLAYNEYQRKMRKARNDT